MIQKVRVATKKGEIRTILGLKSITKVTAVKVYRLEGISKKEAKILAEKLLSESINQKYTINKSIKESSRCSSSRAKSRGSNNNLLRPSEASGEVTIEIAYKPGVMNPEAASIVKAAADLGVKLLACDSSTEYVFYGSLKREKAEKIIKSLGLYNPLIEQIVSEEPQTLIITGITGKTQIIPIRNLSDKKLMDLSKDKLFLNLEEMKTIQKYFQKIKRDPTDLELETLAQTWSEHCAHKTFKAKIILDSKEKEPFLERLKKEALKHNRNIVSAFVDNAGVMDFYEGWAINGKAETHNAPSAIEPYGGAMTGLGGVFRDVVATGQGARVVVSTDIFCLATPDMDKNKLPAGTLPPDYILKRVVTAVRDYGNRVGIPTNNGSFHFDDDFRAKPIVLVGAYGILPKEKAKKGKPKVGDITVVIGGRTGRDGIHGATFSSGEMTERTMEVNAQAVQIGNAIEEKRMFDAILEARDKNLIRALQDLGAGGFSSAIGETGAETGVTVHLEKAPLKYQGLAPWEIFLSESQERMLIILPPKKLNEFLEICKKYNVEAVEIAEFDGSKRLQVFYGKEKVGDLEMKFLHGGLPQRVLQAKRNLKSQISNLKFSKAPKTEEEWIETLEKVLSSGDINSKEPILRMYDHNVQGTNALHPFTGVGMDGPNDAVVIKPLLDKPYGLVVAHGLNPKLTSIDSYWGTIWSATEAISNYVAVGGDYKNASLINNYIWPFPDEEWLGKLELSVDAVVDFMKALKIPVISGKDSLSATYRSKDLVLHSPPTLIMSVFGKIPDVKKTTSSDFKKVGSNIVLVGKQDIKVDLKVLSKVLDKLHKAIVGGGVLACHDVSEGGLITSIFEMCVGGGMGVEIDLDTSDGGRLERSGSHDSSEVESDFLFNETAGCFIVEVEDEKIAKKLFTGVPFKILGKTTEMKKITVEGLFSIAVDRLEKVWKQPMKEIFG